MAKDQSSEPKGEEIPELTDSVLKEFQELTNPKERRDFYLGHPELGRLYSAVNFHV